MRDLAPKGRLRAAINFGNGVLVQKGADGEAHGVSPDLARALAQRLGVPVELVAFPSAGATFAAASTDAWDVAFLAIDPDRAAAADFSPPYVVIQGAYMVRQQAPFQTIADVDKPGVTVGVGQGSIYDLFLTRTLKGARLVRNPKGGATGGIEPFLAQSLDVAAGVREPMEAYVHDHPDMRLLPGSFEEIRQAIATPKNSRRGGPHLAPSIRRGQESGRLRRRCAQTLRPERSRGPAGRLSHPSAGGLFDDSLSSTRSAPLQSNGDITISGSCRRIELRGSWFVFHIAVFSSDRPTTTTWLGPLLGKP